MLRAERLTLATDALVYFAHWITPEIQPLRFDTRFFAAPMPEGQEAVADEREITEVRWLTPREALDANARGQLSLRNPTVKNLQLFDGAATAAAALARLDGARGAHHPPPGDHRGRQAARAPPRRARLATTCLSSWSG